MYAVTERVELTAAVSLILGSKAAKLNNLAIIISLQVALCAYIVTFSETTRNLFCRPSTCQAQNYTEVLNDAGSMCGESHTEYFMFVIFMAIFILGTSPLCMLNIGDNSYVQIVGTVLRWCTITSIFILPFLNVF